MKRNEAVKPSRTFRKACGYLACPAFLILAAFPAAAQSTTDVYVPEPMGEKLGAVLVAISFGMAFGTLMRILRPNKKTPGQ